MERRSGGRHIRFDARRTAPGTGQSSGFLAQLSGILFVCEQLLWAGLAESHGIFLPDLRCCNLGFLLEIFAGFLGVRKQTA